MPPGNPEAYQGGPDNKGFANLGQWWKALQGPTGAPIFADSPNVPEHEYLEGMDLMGEGPEATEYAQAIDPSQQNGMRAISDVPANAASALASVVPPRKPAAPVKAFPPPYDIEESNEATPGVPTGPSTPPAEPAVVSPDVAPITEKDVLDQNKAQTQASDKEPPAKTVSSPAEPAATEASTDNQAKRLSSGLGRGLDVVGGGADWLTDLIADVINDVINAGDRFANIPDEKQEARIDERDAAFGKFKEDYTGELGRGYDEWRNQSPEEIQAAQDVYRGVGRGGPIDPNELLQTIKDQIQKAIDFAKRGGQNVPPSPPPVLSTEGNLPPTLQLPQLQGVASSRDDVMEAIRATQAVPRPAREAPTTGGTQRTFSPKELDEAQLRSLFKINPVDTD
jgi:hypothetical protein